MPASTDYINQYEHNGTYYDLHDVDLRSKIGTANGIAELDSSGLVPASQLPSYVDDVKNGYYANSQFYPESSPTYPGYFYNNEFYKDIDHTIVITPVTDSYYYDISGNEYYTYDGSAYAQTTAPTAMTPENDKIYVNLAADPAEIYRWSGIAYVKMSSGDGGLVLGETSETAYRGDRGKTAYDHSQDSGRITSAVASGLYKVAATAQGHVAGLTAVQKSDITALGIPESDTNTTYTFENGTNGFTVTPSNGSPQTVTVTPSITDNVTGSGTNGSLTKFNGTNTVTNGPTLSAAVSSQTQSTKFLREDGEWSAPSYTTNTDRYVNSAGFAYDSTNDDVKMTLTRAGSDTAQVTGNIPKVSSSSAGVVPKGAAVSSQSQTTKFLREDGTWAAPSYGSGTTYTFAGGTNGFTVTPAGGTAETVSVTPSIANNITGSGTSGYLTKFNGANTITNGPALSAAVSSQTQSTKFLREDGTWSAPSYTTNTDTKNTAGSTDTSSKIFLIGATSQAANPQTYSDNEVYATNGVLTTKSVQVGGTAATMQYNATTQSIDFIFA